MNASQIIARIIADPCASYWLKNALQESLTRDPVDALNDTELLAEVLQKRFTEITQGGN